METKIVQAGVDVPVEEPTPEAFVEEVKATPLNSLKSKREEILKGLHTNIRVPRWDSPKVYVRCKPVSPTFLNKVLDVRSKEGMDDWAQRANCDILVESCLGVYYVPDGEPNAEYSFRSGDPKGKLTKFDVDLTDSLEVDAGPTDQTTVAVRSLFLGGDGDINDAAGKLLKFSNIGNAEADTTF